MAEYIEIIECRDCESKNCYGCNVLTLSQMLNQGKFDSLMDEHYSINPAADVVEVKHGEWETVPNREFDGFETVVRGEAERCTNCCRASKDFKKWFERCPHCGARMDGDV